MIAGRPDDFLGGLTDFSIIGSNSSSPPASFDVTTTSTTFTSASYTDLATSNSWGPIAIEVVGDPGIVTELVALAKADNREDFLFLAGSAGVPLDHREELWRGTRARLNKPAAEPQRVVAIDGRRSWWWAPDGRVLWTDGATVSGA